MQQLELIKSLGSGIPKLRQEAQAHKAEAEVLRKRLQDLEGPASDQKQQLEQAEAQVAALEVELAAARDQLLKASGELALERRSAACLRSDLQLLVSEQDAVDSIVNHPRPPRHTGTGGGGREVTVGTSGQPGGSSRTSMESVTFWVQPPALDKEDSGSSTGTGIGSPDSMHHSPEVQMVATLRASLMTANSKVRALQHRLEQTDAAQLALVKRTDKDAEVAAVRLAEAEEKVAEAESKVAQAEAGLAALQEELSTAIDALARTEADHAAQLKAVAEEKQQVQARVKELEEQMRSAKEAGDAKGAELDVLAREYDQQATEAKDKCQVIEAELRAVQAALDAAKAEAASLQTQLQETGDCRSAAEGEVQALKAGQRQAQEEAGRLQEAVDVLQKQVQAGVQAQQALEVRILLLEAELAAAAEAAAERDVLEGKMAQALADLEAASTQLSHAREECGKAQCELAALQQASEKAASAFSKLQSENQELSRNYSELTSSYEEACAESQRLQLRNHSLTQEVDEQQAELLDWEMRMRVQGERVNELQQQLAAAEEQHERVAWEAGELRRELKQTTDTLNAELADVLRNQQASVQQAYEERDEAERRQQEQEALLERLSHQNEHQRAQINDYVERVGNATIEQVNFKLQITALEDKCLGLQQVLDAFQAGNGAAVTAAKAGADKQGLPAHAVALIRTASELSSKMCNVHSEWTARLKTPRTTGTPRVTADSVDVSDVDSASRVESELEEQFQELKVMYDKLYLQFRVSKGDGAGQLASLQDGQDGFMDGNSLVDAGCCSASSLPSLARAH